MKENVFVSISIFELYIVKIWFHQIISKIVKNYFNFMTAILIRHTTLKKEG